MPHLLDPSQPDPEPQKPVDLDLQLKRVFLALGLIAVAAASIYALRSVWPALQWAFSVLSPFLIALVLAYVFHPVVSFVEKRLHVGRGIAMALIAAFLTVLVIVILTVLVILLIQLEQAFAASGQQISERIKQWHGTFLGVDKAQISAYLMDVWAKAQANLQEVARNLLPRIGQGTLSVAGGIASGIGAVISLFALAIFALMITFYLLWDFDQIPRIVRILVPDDREERFFYLWGKVDKAVGGYLRGQILDCVAVGILSAILMMLVGPRKWAFLIGFAAGAVNFIPYLGPATGAIPAIFWALFTFSGWQAVWRALMIVGAFAVVQSVDGAVFQPRIVGKHSQLHPLAVIFAILLGARFGFGGMIVAVPVAAVVRVLLKEMWWDALADRYRRRQQAEE